MACWSAPMPILNKKCPTRGRYGADALSIPSSCEISLRSWPGRLWRRSPFRATPPRARGGGSSHNSGPMLCIFWPPAPGLAGCRLFSLPESRARLADLEGVSRQLQSKKVKVLAIPRDIDQIPDLNLGFKSPALVSDGSREAFDAYALLRRSFSEEGTLPDPPVPPHLEFIIDRQGYVRARWIPRDGPGWDRIENLMREIDRLNQEKPTAPALDDHVH